MNKRWLISIASLGILCFSAGVIFLLQEQEQQITSEVRGASDSRETHSVLVKTHGKNLSDLNAIRLVASELGKSNAEVPVILESVTDARGEAVFQLPEGRYLIRAQDQEKYAGSRAFQLSENTLIDLRLIDKSPQESSQEEAGL